MRQAARLKMPDPIDSVCITGMGMVSSLGLDAETSCAAARAGIVRAGEIDYFPVLSAVEGEPESAIGHPVPLLTYGFEGNTRLMRLLQGGLADLMNNLSHANGLLGRAEFYLSLPNSLRLSMGYDIDDDQETRQSRVAKAREAERCSPDWATATRILQDVARLLGWPSKPSLRFVTCSGTTGVIEALHQARADLAAGLVEAAVVGGADSLLEETTLNWLKDTGRMKTPQSPAGLQPGEGSAFVLLETEWSAQNRGAQRLGVIRGLHLVTDSWTLISEESPLGLGLESAISNISTLSESQSMQPVWLITDQNGEPHRAMEWGNAVVRLRARSQVFAEPILWYPAASFGDTAAASGAIALCIAMCAFERGYAPAQIVTIGASSDGPLRAAALLSQPNTQRSRSRQ